MKTCYSLNPDRLRRLAAAFIILVALAISAQSAQDQRGYTLIEFDVAGFQDTFPEDNNAVGAIVGKARDANGEGPAFVRAPNGAITAFDIPAAGTGAFQGTIPANINNLGAIDGSYIDASDVAHGFVRAPDGSIVTFDAPGAGTGPFQGTFPDGINDAGAITGYYIDNNDVLHGFLRTRTARKLD